MINAQRVLDRLSPWHAEGGGVLGVCPSHNDTNPSLKVDITESGRILLYCRAGCDSRSVARDLGVDFYETYRWPEGMTGVSAARGSSHEVGQGSLAELEVFTTAASRELDRFKSHGELALDYLAERFGMSEDEAAALRLGATEAHGVDWEPIKRSWLAVPRLVVPFLDFQGRARGAQARALEDHTVRWTGLANVDGASWAKVAVMQHSDGLDYVFITEGPSDGLTLYASGYSAIVVRGAALGRSSEVLDELEANLQGRIILVVGDRDPAGDTFRETLLTELTARGMDARAFFVPEPHNDVNDWRISNPDAFRRSIEGAIRQAVGGTVAPRNVWTDWTGHPSPGTSNAIAAEALIWYMERSGNAAIYIRGYGPVAYANGRWWPAHEHKLRTIVHEAGRQARALDPNDQNYDGLRAFGAKLGQRYFIDATIRELAAMVPELEADDLDAREELLLVGNGVVNLRTGELEEPRPDMYLSNRVATNYSPSAEAPRWEEFLSEVMEGDGDMVAFIQRLIGYGITGSTAEQCFAILHGRGANGKSVFTETLSYVFGAVTRTVPFSVFEEGSKGSGPSPELARLRGARLTLTQEGSAGAKIKESLVKSITGSDTITARHLYQEEVEFRPRHLIIMGTNHFPVFHGVDEGLWRRVKLIPFKRYFAPAERDHYLQQKLRDEAEGILAWAVRGAQQWYESGLREPAPVIEATSSLRDGSDILAGFYPGVLLHAPGEDVKLKDVWAAFEKWAEEEGQKEYSSVWLGKELVERGLTKVRRSSGNYILNARLSTEAERRNLYGEDST